MAWFRRDRAEQVPDDVEAAIRAHARGQRELDAGRFASAASIFRQVVAVTPDSSNSQFLLGVALLQDRQKSAAIEPLRRCLAIAPDHAGAHLILGVALGRLDQFDEAEVHLAKAAALGDDQAKDRLADLNLDYCRTCSGPAHRTLDGERADIEFITPRVGLTCDGCQVTICAGCASGGREGPMTLSCSRCRTPLRPLPVTRSQA